jgi:integrase
MNRTPGSWSYITGEKGRNRVRAFEDERTGRIFLDFRSGARRQRIACGHRDREKAKQQAEELALRLRKPTELAREQVTLASLFDNYLREATPTKGSSAQKHDKRTAALALEIFGPNRVVSTLTHRDAARFVSERRRMGDRRQRRRPDKGKANSTLANVFVPLRDRAVGHDLQFVIAALNWGVRGGLFDRNPFQGFRIPTEQSPRRPVVTEKQYRALLEVASSVNPLARFALVLANETGHRIGAIRLLRWTDLELDSSAAKARWRAENDKIGFEHVTPLSAEAVQEIETARRRSSSIGGTWVFPSPSDPHAPVSRNLMRDWWRKMERKAKLPPERGRGWHSLRRKFATELKHVPLKDLSYLGGWKDHQTLLICYQRADEVTMTEALKTRIALQG